MKSPILWLPSLIVVGFVAAVATGTPVTPTPGGVAAFHAEIHNLRQERKVISDRLSRLEAESHHALPRGGA